MSRNLLRIFGCSLAAVLLLGCATQSPPEASPSPLAEPTDPPLVEEETVPQDAPTAEPVVIDTFTPPQQEGPYYIVEKPADRDNDLVALAGASGPPAGQILEFNGTVYGADGVPLPGITLEIWQTDSNGIYNHPGDPQTEQRDRNFQFYGEAVTAEDGSYSFRTLLPGKYEPRPIHIHVKLKDGETELLTTQFYFSNDPSLGAIDPALVIDVVESESSAGEPILTGVRDVYLDINR